MSDWHRILSPMDEWNERVLLSIFALFGVPDSMLDIGSGTGAMVQLARKMGVDAVGIDQIATPPDIRHDLTQPINLGRKFDLVLCLEVAEHIPAKSAHTLCGILAWHSKVNGRLVFSAAPPGQSGDDHVNCQPPTYWRDILYQAGKFSFQRQMTAELALLLNYTGGPLAQWLPGNIQVF